MPALPDRVGACRCPTRPTSSSSVAATPGSTPRASWRVAGSAVTLLEAEHARLGRLDPQRRDRPCGLQVGPARAHRALRRGDRRGALPRDARRLRDRQAADRRRGDRLRLPRGRPPRARLRRRRTWPSSSTRRRALASVGVEASMRPARAHPRGDRHRRLPRGARRRRAAALLHPGRYFAGLAAAADRAGADLHEGVRARTDPAPGGRPVRRRDGPRRDPGPRRRRRHERLHGRRRARRSAGGSSRSAATSSRPSRSPRTWHGALAEGPGVLRHEELPLLLARLGGPPDGLRRPGEHAADDRSTGPPRSSTTACSRSIRSSPATGSTTRGAATSASRSTGCRTSGGRTTASPTRWAAAAPGVALMTHLGTEVGEWLAGGEAPALARLKFPLVPAPYEGRPWFLPFVGEWFRLQDRLARGRVRDEDRLPDVAAEHRLGQPRRGLGGGGPARRLRLGLAQRSPDRSGPRSRRAELRGDDDARRPGAPRARQGASGRPCWPPRSGIRRCWPRRRSRSTT